MDFIGDQNWCQIELSEKCFYIAEKIKFTQNHIKIEKLNCISGRICVTCGRFLLK